MIPNPIIISFFTKDTLYAKEAKELIASCEYFGLEHCIEEVPNLGRWDKNCCQKPLYILEKLQKFKRAVIWVDSDAIIVKKPEFDLEQYDLAVYISKNPFSVRSGTMYVNYTNGAISLLNRWDKKCQEELQKANRDYEIWDQICLKDILFLEKIDIKLKKLPLGYCRILNRYKEILKKEESFIIHFQASNTYKQLINSDIKESFLNLLPVEELKKLHLSI